MKKLFVYTLFVLTLGLLSTSVQAQYKHALGGRFGTANGISFKTFNGKNDRALDLILNFQSKNDYSYFRFTGLYEIHQNIENADGLRWYYGFGGTLGSRNYKPTDDNELLLGIDGVIGLDYKFNGAPINLSLDWKPTLEVAPNTGLNAKGLGLSFRFTF